MKKSLALLLLVSSLSLSAIANEKVAPDSWQAVDPQQVDNQYNRKFAFKHDKGFYLAMGIGPQWNQSLQNPVAGAFRFGGKFSIGFVPLYNFAVHANVWGSFLEESSLLAAGPGVTYFFGDSNVGLSAAFGVGQVFSTSMSTQEKFRETVLAGEVGLGKYWWVSENVSLGGTLVTGLHGLTLSNANVSSLGWDIGLRLELIFN